MVSLLGMCKLCEFKNGMKLGPLVKGKEKKHCGLCCICRCIAKKDSRLPSGPEVSRSRQWLPLVLPCTLGGVNPELVASSFFPKCGFRRLELLMRCPIVVPCTWHRYLSCFHLPMRNIGVNPYPEKSTQVPKLINQLAATCSCEPAQMRSGRSCFACFPSNWPNDNRLTAEQIAQLSHSCLCDHATTGCTFAKPRAFLADLESVAEQSEPKWAGCFIRSLLSDGWTMLNQWLKDIVKS